MDPLVTTDWLASELGASDLRILDASFFLPADGRDARAEFESAHIPGAVFLDLEEIADADNPVPGMLPPTHKFAGRMQALGVGDGDRIIVYDNSPHHSSARAWWMLKIFGAQDVAVLDGGLQKWRAEGRPLETGEAQTRGGQFTPVYDAHLLADQALVASVLASPSHELVDARGAQRFAGEEAEPRPGVAPGHIPGSRNLPQARLLNPDNSFKRGEALRAAFEEAGIDLARPMITLADQALPRRLCCSPRNCLGSTT